MNNLQSVHLHLDFLHRPKTPPLSLLAVFAYPLLPPCPVLPPCICPVLSLRALASQGHQNRSPSSPKGKQRDLGMRNDCPGLYPARCSGCSCYWPGCRQLNSYCPGIGRLHCHSHGIGWQQRLEEGQWKELSCQSNALKLEGLEQRLNPDEQRLY